MAKVSAGLVMYRIRAGAIEVLLVHPGGPFWSRKDLGAWFVPKGELESGEDELEAAKREFFEETGVQPQGEFIGLGTVKHKSGKVVHAWAVAGDLAPEAIHSNTFLMEWPPKSGRQQEFPEIDRAAFFGLEDARSKIYPAEFEFVERLVKDCEERGILQNHTNGAVSRHRSDQGHLFD